MDHEKLIAKGKHYLGKLDRNCGKAGTRNCAAYLTWELRADGEFSASGEVWNHIKSDIVMGGQCVDTLAALFPADRRAQAIARVWKRWHLNGMRAGCEHQRVEKWDERPINPAKPLNTYGKHFEGQKYASWNMLTWVSPKEHPKGLLGKPCPTCGYAYGSAWLKEELPEEVKAEILSWIPEKIARVEG